MTNLVTRLRGPQPRARDMIVRDYPDGKMEFFDPLMQEAANEIERLSALLGQYPERAKLCHDGHAPIIHFDECPLCWVDIETAQQRYTPVSEEEANRRLAAAMHSPDEPSEPLAYLVTDTEGLKHAYLTRDEAEHAVDVIEKYRHHKATFIPLYGGSPLKSGAEHGS